MPRHFGIALLSTALLAIAFVHAADEAKIDARGDITQVTPAKADGPKGLLGFIRVEGPRDKAVTYDKAVIKITDKTKITKGSKAAKFEDLKVGTKVQAKFTGPVAESFPVQATASEVMILEEKK